MTTQHTAGPWNISPPCELSPRYSVYHNGPLVYVDRAEDARLIAAAPDLFIALCDLLEDAVALGICESNMSGSAVAARAAITKATGGEA